MMKKWLAAVLMIGILLAGGWYWKSHKTDTRRRAGQRRLVTAAVSSIQETVEATGEVAPLNRVEIKPPIQGRVEKIMVDEGDRVKSGEILAWMSSSDRAAILDAARAQGPAAYKQWEDAYKPTPVVAPLAGVIILKSVVVGQTVDASSVLFALSDRLIVVAQVDEADIGRIRDGMPARITLDAYPDKAVDGKTFQILHEGKNQSNVITYDVKLEPNNVPSFFRSQMTANVVFIVREVNNSIVVPASAVQTLPSGEKQVYVPSEDGKQSVAKTVETGLEAGEQVQILSGLAAGDKLFISRAAYAPQKGPQTSPLTFGGNRAGQSGAGGGQGGRRRSGG